MRKRTKLKKRTCALCKPHKMNWANRWKHREHMSLKLWERERELYFKTNSGI